MKVKRVSLYVLISYSSPPLCFAVQVASKPYWGVFGPYKRTRDPWANAEV